MGKQLSSFETLEWVHMRPAGQRWISRGKELDAHCTGCLRRVLWNSRATMDLATSGLVAV